jgi:hypothetical protein
LIAAAGLEGLRSARRKSTLDSVLVPGLRKISPTKYLAVTILGVCSACSLVTSFDRFTGGAAGDDGGAAGDATAAHDVGPGPDAVAGEGQSGDDAAGDDSTDFDASAAPDSGGVVEDASPAVDSTSDDAIEPDVTAPDAGGPDDASGPDAADTGADATGTDADAGGITDAGSEAPTGWCSGQPSSLLFCDDFDEAPIETGFDSLTGKNCTWQLAAGTATSSPNALNPASASGAQAARCRATRALPGAGANGGTYTLSFDVYPTQVDRTNTSDAVVAVVGLSDATGTIWSLQFELAWDKTNNWLGVNLSEDATLPDGGEQYHTTPAAIPLPLQTWTRVSLQLTVDPQNVPTVGTLSFGPTKLATATLHPATTNPTMSLILGFDYLASGNATWSILYDNVTFTAQ